MTDNFNLIKEYIKTVFSIPQKNKQGNADLFYNIEIIRRGKDNPNMPAANYKLKSYHIYCIEDFDKYESEIKTICDILKMRAYISVNCKSTKQIALNTLTGLASRIAMGDFKKIYKEFDKQTSLYSNKENKIWVLDIDDVDLTSQNDINYIEKIKNIVSQCDSKTDNSYVFSIPTRTGIHLLYKPFNKYQFDKLCVENNINKIDIKKNHITLLYENL